MSEYKTIKTYYHYRVTLDREIAELEATTEEGSRTKYIIHYRDDEKIIENYKFEWSEEHPITYKEAVKIVKGTKGIKTISGEFKIK